MNDVIKFMVSKEDFKKYFGCKNIISKKEYLYYLDKKSCQISCQNKKNNNKTSS